MKHDHRCAGCLLSRVNLELDLGKTGKSARNLVYGYAEDKIRFLHSTPLTHPMIASDLHRSIYSKIGDLDPFIELKNESQAISLAVFREVSSRLCGFRELVTAAVIGNTFDYGVKGHEVTEDFLSFFNSGFSKGLSIDDTDKILSLCNDVVYFTDNCGEIVFDKYLISWLKDNGCRITLVVRDRPILNDATIDEVHALGLEKIVDCVMTTGAGIELGIRFDLLSDELMKTIDRCSLIISKGMANYESLREEEGLPPVAYLLAAKCEPIAEELGVKKGDMIAMLRNYVKLNL
jgi:hypothetical protein